MNTSLEFQKCRQDDLDVLYDLVTKTFVDTYASFNTEENMQLYLEASLSKERIRKELENRDSVFYFVYFGDTIIGYIKVNVGEAQTAIKEEHSVEIERVYLLKEYQGKRLGQMLLNKALSIAREKQAAYVWLNVWSQNYRAIRFYEKSGFKKHDTHVFVLGNDRQKDWMMKKELL